MKCTAIGSSGSCSSARGRVMMRAEDLDYDVAVFLRGMADRWQEFDRLAQALISERAGRVPKTHDGVRSRFNLLTRGDARVDDGIPRC